MWERYLTPHTLDEAVAALGELGRRARIVAGATDLILELERGVRPDVRVLIDVSRLPGLADIALGSDGRIHLGPLVTHNQAAASRLIQQRAFALARACWEVGAPQIRNRGTIAGNLITASPANDSITPLMALGAAVTLRSREGERRVPLPEFYTGVRKTVMRADEVLVDIAIDPLPDGARSTFIKLALRRAQAVSVVNVAVVVEWDGPKVSRAAVTLGSVAPTIVHASEAEAYLAGKTLSEEAATRAAELAAGAARPIDDVRGSAAYRREMVRICTLRALRSLAARQERDGYPGTPVLLASTTTGEVHNLPEPKEHRSGTPIETTINGHPHVFTTGQDKTLLRLLREDGHLIGTKEGCAEGECGACTVFLDGQAVMACMVPAPRAHRAEIVTIEGLARDGQLHPIQQAFLDQGAVQCGYCTPGFLMAGAMLLAERPGPDAAEIRQAITGNLCRCTGYYKIIAAFEQAAREAEREPAGRSAA
ncbi:MAG TPA: FAD binding domain-containing protein [Anaerolineales bacterium]|nr:FAD binding domain-containing protein [Anaerolineales bacterium]